MWAEARRHEVCESDRLRENNGRQWKAEGGGGSWEIWRVDGGVDADGNHGDDDDMMMVATTEVETQGGNTISVCWCGSLMAAMHNPDPGQGEWGAPKAGFGLGLSAVGLVAMPSSMMDEVNVGGSRPSVKSASRRPDMRYHTDLTE